MDLRVPLPVISASTPAVSDDDGGGTELGASAVQGEMADHGDDVLAGCSDGNAQELGECPAADFQVLPQDQIDEYLREGVLVVPNILSQQELRLALEGMKSSLHQRLITSKNKDTETSDQVDLDEFLLDPSSSSSSSSSFDKVDLVDALRKFRDELSSTNGSGGVLDIFWDEWKLQLVAHNPKLWQATKQLWKAVYSDSEDIQDKDDWRYHPYNKNETLDFDKGYCYIDRVGYRLPTSISEEWGDMLYEHDQKHQEANSNENGIPSSKKKKKKFRSVQRSLTPHLDCCPNNLWGRTDCDGDNGTTNSNAPNHTRPPQKWRPIQCFIALTDTLNKNEGGFECVPGFHHEFHDWAKNRQIHGGESTSSSPSSLCVGEYTHIRPTEERHIMDRVQHIRIQAGSAVFWDVRIPHANSYRNTTNRARQVVYCSFLPDIELNRSYVKNQLLSYQQNQPIRDQWNHISTTATITTTATANHSVFGTDINENHKDNDGVDTNSANSNNNQNAQDHGNDCSKKPATSPAFTVLGQKLMGMKRW